MKPSEIYLEKVAQGLLIEDEQQFDLLKRLDVLYTKLTSNSNRWFFKERIKGLYIRGEVGRGKTQLMDIFFSCLPKNKSKRIHFHRFMQELHKDLESLSGVKDPVAKTARSLSKKYEILCFDEFFVEDIGDAMLLSRFLNKLFDLSVTLVTTSNFSPDDLYKDGLHRSRFIPAINSIKRNCDIYELKSSQDYRLRTLAQENVHLLTSDRKNEEILNRLFESLSSGEYKSGSTLKILGRKIRTKQQADGIVWFNFIDICEGSRSKDDYIEISKEFHTLIISDIPVLNRNKEDAARRFISLVDECYERNVKLIISSEIDLSHLYTGDKLTGIYKRTASRLEEMRSKEFLSRPHLN